MPTLRERVERVLDEADPADGLAVFSQDLKLLAERDAAPDGGCQIVVLDVEPPGIPEPHHRQAEQRRSRPKREEKFGHMTESWVVEGS